MSKIKGGCLCGAIRYESQAEPVVTVICHCFACQKASGSAYTLNIAVPADSVTVTGDTLASWPDNTPASGKILNRAFCSKCGSQMYGEGDGNPGLMFIRTGTLDDTSWLKPGIQVWSSEKQPWVIVQDGITDFPGNPG